MAPSFVVIRPLVNKVEVVSENDKTALCDKECQLIAPGVIQCSQVDTRDVRAERRSQVDDILSPVEEDTGVFMLQSPETGVGVFERLERRVFVVNKYREKMSVFVWGLFRSVLRIS